jgi:hypothetical protein
MALAVEVSAVRAALGDPDADATTASLRVRIP